MKLQLRAIGSSADIDQLVTAIAADSSLRLARVHRGLEAREPGSERAYIDVEKTTRTDTTESAA